MIIPVNLGKAGYDITLKRGALKRAGEILNLDRKVLIVTDSGVPKEYGESICRAAKTPVMAVIEAGEGSKNLGEFERLCRIMLENGFTRKDCVVAVGGGVVGDLAGFAAACYMRGIDFYNVPTTLLSQVDSSIGGKTAVDLGGVKNIVGAFYQPKAVIIDPDVLDTLSPRQLACGSAEIIKMAMCFDRDFFEAIEKTGIKDNKDNLEDIIAGSLKIKAAVVEKDEKESDLRRALNFGHTLGHGIESVTGLLHGECVALGMLPMCSRELRPRLERMLEREGLPVKWSVDGADSAAPTDASAPACAVDADAVIEAAMHDKKAEAGSVITVRVDEIGKFKFMKASKEMLTADYEEVFKA